MDNKFFSSREIPDLPQIPDPPRIPNSPQIPDPPQISDNSFDLTTPNFQNNKSYINQKVKIKATVCKENSNQLSTHEEKEHDDPYLDLKNEFLLGVVNTFMSKSWQYMDLLEKLRDKKINIAVKKEAFLKDCEKKTAEYDSIIAKSTEEYDKIISLLSKSGIKIKKYEHIKEIKYTPLFQFEQLLNAWENSNLITRSSRKDKIAYIGKSAVNYLNHIIENNKADKADLQQNMPVELKKIESEFEDFLRKIQLEFKKTVQEFADYLKSYDLQEININWEKYLEKYQISKLTPYNDNQRDAAVCMGYHIYCVPFPDEMANAIHKAYDSLNFIEDHVAITDSHEASSDEMIDVITYFKTHNFIDDYATRTINHEIRFKVPAFDNMQDDTNKYYFKLSSSEKEQVQNGIQSYLLRLLAQSTLNEYDFVFMDPVSNGKSFCDIISLVRDDGYGISNTVFCDKNEISKALSDLSNKIKQINQIIRGYSSIYEYNKDHPNNTIKTTVLIAYNFCDENYREDQLSPIFENADKCGITIFAVAPFAGTFSSERIERVVYAYPTKLFSLKDETHGGIIVRDLPNKSKTLFDYFEFADKQLNSVEWIESYNDILKKGVMICSAYSDIKDKLPECFSLDSTNGLHIPFAVDKRNHIVDFNLAVDLCYHAFISGTTGIGKSVLLHSIIANTIRSYHPDDVELWLVDYKAVEFIEYVKNKPPHIKFVGLDRSKEFTKSYLHKIHNIITRKKKLIMDAGFQKIEEYKSHFGANSIPRSILIIDEAHVLSQHLSEDEELKQFFENMLSEDRSFGLSIILSDQAFRNSMRGITEKGKAQIGVRIAMKNSFDEIDSILEVDNSYYQDQEFKNNINTLSTGEAINRWNEKLDDGGARLHLDKVKAIYTDRQNDRTEIIKTANMLAEQTGFKPKECYLVLGSERASIFDSLNPFDQMKCLGGGVPKEFEIILGTPSSLEPFHKITMIKRKAKNMLLLCAKENIQLAISLYTALNFSKLFNSKIFVMAAENRLSDEFKSYFTAIFGDNLKIAESAKDYDDSLNQIKDCESCLVIWFGIDELLDDMELLESPKTTSVANSENALYDIFGNPKISERIGNTELYNRTSEIIDLLDKGSAYGKFSLVIVETMREILMRRDISTDFFAHKLAFNISSDDSYSLFGTSKTIDVEGELKASTVIYNDGVSYNILRPFKVEEKLKTYFGNERGK